MKKIILLISVFIFGLTLTPVKVMAISIADSSIIVDWDTFTMQISGDIAFNSSYTSILASAYIQDPWEQDIDSRIVPTWATESTASAAVSTNNAVASSYSSQDSLILNGNSFSDGSNPENWANSGSTRWGIFYADLLGQGGSVILSIDYILEIDTNTSTTGDTAIAATYATLKMVNTSANDSVLDSDFLFGNAIDGNSVYDYASGTLTVEIDYAAGEEGYFNLQLSSASHSTSESAPVPEPRTIIILGIGLVGMAFLSKFSTCDVYYA